MSSGKSSLDAQRPLLRLTQSSEDGTKFRVQINLEIPGEASQQATAQFSFDLTSQERENLRWYFEDYLQHPVDPAPQIADRIEQWMTDKGQELFDKLFKGNEDTRLLWSNIRQRLNDTRVEVSAGVHEATAVPWELLRDGYTDILMALRAGAFVRTQSSPVFRPQIPATSSSPGPIRILLVICRPGKANDVPFRSVASRIVKSLTDEARSHFTLDVLRPPTFEHLTQTLRGAHDAGVPYHVVHFDGHGAFLDLSELFDKWRGTTREAEEPEAEEALDKQLREAGLTGFDSRRYSPELMYPNKPRKGNKGYLVFENPQSAHNLRLVDGPELGELLTEAQVPVLVLNACRSAHAEAPTKPEAAQAGEGEGVEQVAKPTDSHARTRAYGSLAQEVADAGVAGVVAMRYNVYVVTAAQFVANLYASLTAGYTLGEAVRVGRRQLHDAPMRAITYDPVRLEDWPVPVVYEAAPISIFPRLKGEGGIQQLIDPEAEAAPARGELDPKLPKPPDAGFYGRDETLLALDRAFDEHHVVLLHAYAGSGKTSTAAEFARWYSLTGGVKGPVLFTSFEQPVSLARTLDTLGRMFGPALEQPPISWSALSDTHRRGVALTLMKQIPLLWIWDNVEQVAGFPAGTLSTLSREEQRELADFLHDARSTKAKFLLTSRRDEQGWLGNLPARVQIPPMPMLERLELAKALAAKYGRRLDDVEDWRPLLRYTQGNPLTITVVVGQALRDKLSKAEQIQAYVARLKAGEATFEVEETEGRTKSLGASLRYGFSHAFSEEEREQLALLHLFQGFVDVDALRVMGNPEMDWSVPAVRGITRERGIVLLDRAAEVGLLTALGGGYFTIHPALPWYFKALFDHHYVQNPHSPIRAYVEAIGTLSNFYHRQYELGNRDVIGVLRFEEDNLLYARQLARTHNWWTDLVGTMQGLNLLYDFAGRGAEWKRLVEEIVPDFVDPATDGPMLEREEAWSIVNDYRVKLARNARQWAEAERLQKTNVEWCRKEASPLLTVKPNELDDEQRNTIRSLAVSLGLLGHILREQDKLECLQVYQEYYNLGLYIDDKSIIPVAAFNLGRAYIDVDVLSDLEQAEVWFKRSLEFRDKRDRLGRAKCHGQLGLVAYQRFLKARDAREPDEELLGHLNAALKGYLQALDLLPSGAIDAFAVTHNQLGNIYSEASDLDSALVQWQKSIYYQEAQGNPYGAAQSQFNIARNLALWGRLDEALLYAQAAFRSYQEAGPGAAEEVQDTQKLIAAIEALIEEAKNGG